MKIGIVTDNTCNLTPEEIKELKLDVVSLYINRDGKYTKATELNLEEYYKELASAKELPMTSQPSPQDFMGVFQGVLDTYDELIVPVLSGKLSGTYISASIAAKDFDKPIHVVDTLLAADGVGMLLKNLSEKIERGQDTDSLVSYASDFYKKIRTIFSVDDLNYLYKGGRIGKAKALMGNLLKMKPIIRLEEGELKPIENVRGNKKLLQSMVEHTLEGKPVEELKRVMVLSIWRSEDATFLEEELRRKAGEIDIDIRTIEPVIGTHLGPQGIGLISEWS